MSAPLQDHVFAFDRLIFPHLSYYSIAIILNLILEEEIEDGLEVYVSSTDDSSGARSRDAPRAEISENKP